MNPVLTNLLSGLAGSAIGAAAAIWAGYAVGRQNKRLQEEDRKKLAKSAMLAIKAELTMLRDGYLAEMDELLNSTGERQMIESIYKVRQNYLTVYESNCAILGLLPAEEMTAVVRAYTEVKVFIDVHRANSDLYDLYLTARRPSDGIHYANKLLAYSSVVRSSFQSAKIEVQRALETLVLSNVFESE